MTVTERDGRTFDWRPRFDPRSLNFRAAPRVTQMPTTGRIWRHGAVLDQGAEGACVGFASAGVVAAAPASRSGVTDEYARNWYRRAQRLDEWPGERYEGTSVLAGCLVGRERKLWTGFRWAKNAAELATGILNDRLGPALIGVQWSEDLYEVPASGAVDPDVTLDPDMGHAVVLFGYVPARAFVSRELQDQLEELQLWDAVDELAEPSFLLLNSWDDTWAAGGRAVVPVSLVNRWIRARGEFGLPEGRTKGAARMSEQQEQEGPSAAAAAGDDGSKDTTLHITAVDVLEGDRLLDPPDQLGQESVTVRGTPRLVRSWSGRRVVIDSTAGVFQLGAGDAVVVRRTT